MRKQAAATVVHIGICTSDVERSVEFYTQALGFTLTRALDDLGAPYDSLIELPGIQFCGRVLKSGDVAIELIGYANGKVVGPTERRPMNQLGFTHMTLAVEDVDVTAARVATLGGHVHPETRIDSPFGPMVFCTDPDGVRIELIQGGG